MLRIATKSMLEDIRNVLPAPIVRRLWKEASMPLPSATCSVVIGGAFDPRLSIYIEDATQQVAVEAGIVQTTTLLAHPADLAAFIGLLNLLVDFHVPVIACAFRGSAPIQTTVDANA